MVLYKKKKDKEGRMICIQALTEGVKINICNVYAPNKEDSSFIHMLGRTMGEVKEAQLLTADHFLRLCQGID